MTPAQAAARLRHALDRQSTYLVKRGPAPGTELHNMILAELSALRMAIELFELIREIKALARMDGERIGNDQALQRIAHLYEDDES